MCYSIEVQLGTSLIIIVSALFYHFHYAKQFSASRDERTHSILRAVTLVFLCIGLHQFFEFASLVTNDQWVYKAGLLISISAMYFVLDSLDTLARTTVFKKIAFALIALVGIQVILSPLQFEAGSFYVKHLSAYGWAAAWLFLFFVWVVGALLVRKNVRDATSRKTILLYIAGIGGVSFVLSAVYVLVGHFFFSLNVCTDAPSIWCTFYVLQCVMVPLFLSRLPAFLSHVKKESALSLSDVLRAVFVAAALVGLLVVLLPFLDCSIWMLIFL